MPTFNSDEYALFVANPSISMAANMWGGKVRARYALFSGATGFAQNDFVRLFPIYKGERPLYFIMRSEANTASGTIDIGLEGGTENKYVSAQACDATPVHAIIQTLSRVPETANGVVALKFEGANPSDTADIEITMVYMAAD